MHKQHGSYKAARGRVVQTCDTLGLLESAFLVKRLLKVYTRSGRGVRESRQSVHGEIMLCEYAIAMHKSYA